MSYASVEYYGSFSIQNAHKDVLMLK